MLGWNVLYEDIELNRGDWILELESDRGVLPAGTTATVEWATGEVWPATIDGALAKWRVEYETHRTIHNGTAFVVMVRYPNEPADSIDDFEFMAGVAWRPIPAA